MSLPKGNSTVTSNVVVTGQVTEGLSDQTLQFYENMFEYIKDINKNMSLIGSSLSNIYNIIESESEKFNNYVDFILDPHLNMMSESLSVISNFINAISKGQDNYLKDYFKNNAAEEIALQNSEDIFKNLLIKYLSEINENLNSFTNNVIQTNPIQKNNNSPIENKPTENPLSDKKINLKEIENSVGKDSKDFKNISQNIDGILNSFTSIVKKYADDKQFKNIDKVKKNFKNLVLSLESILYELNDILDDTNEEKLNNIIIFNTITSNMVKSVNSLVELIESLTDNINIKSLIKARISIWSISKVFEDLNIFAVKTLDNNINWKDIENKFKAIEDSLEPTFDLINTISNRKSIKDLLKTYIYIFTIETIINKTLNLLDIIDKSNVNLESSKIEEVIKNLDLLSQVVNKFSEMNLISAYISTLYAGKVFEEILKAINKMAQGANKADNLQTAFETMGLVIDSVSKSFWPLIKLSIFTNRIQKGAVNFSDLVSLIVYTFVSTKAPKSIIRNANNINELMPIYMGILVSISKTLPLLLLINIFNKIYKKGIDNLDDILVITAAVFINPLFTGKVIKNIKDTNKGLTEIITLFKPLSLLGLMYLELIIVSKIYDIGTNVLCNILNTLNEKFSKEIISKNTTKEIKNIKDFIYTLGSLTYALIIVSLGMLLLIPLLPILAIGLLGIKLIVSLTSVLFNGSNMKDLRKNISSFSYSLLLITASFLLFAMSMLVLGQVIISGELVKGTLLFFGYITGVYLFMWMLEKFNKDVRKGCLGLILTSLAMVAVAASLYVVSLMVSKIDYTGMLSFMFYTAIIVGITALIGMLKSQVLMGALVVVALSVTLMILAASILAVSSIMEGVKFGNLMLLVGATIAFGLIFGLIGIPVVAGFVALGSLVVMLMSITLMVLAKSIKDINDIMLGVSEKDVDRICTNFNTYLMRISWTFVKAMPLLLLAMPGLFSAMLMGKALSNLALGIQSFSNLNIPIAWDENGKPIAFRQMNSKDFENASNNIALILTTLVEPLAAFGGYGSNDLFNRQKMRAIKKGIKLAGRLGESISSIAGGIQDMAMLKMPIEWDEKGKPKNYRNLNSQDFQNASNNIALILTTLANPLADFGGNVDENGNFQRGRYKAIKKGIKAAGNLGSSIGSLAEGIRMMAELKMPDYDKDGRIIEGKYRVLTTNDFNNVAINIDTILNCFSKALEEWIDKHPEYLDSNWIGRSKAGKSLKIVGQIGTTIANLATGIQAMADLKVAKYDESGKIVGYEQITIDEAKIKANISSILNIVLSVFDSYNDKEKDLKRANKIIDKLNKPVEKIASIINTFNNMLPLDDKKLTAVQSLNNVLRKELEYYNSGSALYMNGLKVMEQAIPSFESLLKIDDFSDKGIANFEKANKDFEKFVNNSNKIKLEPVRAMTQMLDKLNSLVKSAGSMDNLAQALGEKIAPVLKELVETLMRLEEKSEKIINEPKSNNTMNNNSDKTNSNIKDNKDNKDNKNEKDNLSQLITKINSLVGTIENGLNVRVQGDVSIRNSTSAGPIKVQG